MAKDAQEAFFSYCREDSDFALRLAADLKAAGASVWMDQLDILPGQRWDRAVEDALTNCTRMLVILSPASVESTNVMDEASFALEEQKTVIPIICRDCTVPFRLRRVQRVDFRKDYARGLTELLKVLSPQREERSAPLPSDVPSPASGGRPDVGERGPASSPLIEEEGWARVKANEDAEAHLKLGSKLLEQGDMEAAVAKFRDGVRLRPEYAEAHVGLALALLKKGDLEESIAECQESIRLAPELSEAHFGLGSAFLTKGDMEAAITEFREVVRLTPYSAEGHLGLGLGLIATGDHQQAVGEIRRAYKLDPSNQSVRSCYEKLVKSGRAKVIVEEAPGRIVDTRKQARESPNEEKTAKETADAQADAHLKRGNELDNEGNLDGAIAEHREAIRLNPDHSGAHMALGAALFKKHDVDEAIAEFRKVIRLAPELGVPHMALGLALLQKGDRQQAVRELRRAYELDPNDPTVSLFYESVVKSKSAD